MHQNIAFFAPTLCFDREKVMLLAMKSNALTGAFEKFLL